VPFLTAVLDDFNRADASTLGANWTNLNGASWRIVSNEVAPGTINGRHQAMWSAGDALTDSEAYITLRTFFDWQLVGVRVSGSGSSNTGYYARYGGSTTLEIVRWISNTETSIGSYTIPALSAGDKIGIRAIGTTISVWYYQSGSWNKAGEVTDSNIASGELGIQQGVSSGNHSGRMDDFGGGAVGIEFRSSNTNSSNSTNSLALNKPSGLTNGDVMFAWIGFDHGAFPNSAPSGWVEIDRQGRTFAEPASICYYKVVTDAGSEPASYSWGWASSASCMGVIEAWRGIDNTTVLDTTVAKGNGSNNVTTTSITIATAGAKLFLQLSGNPVSSSDRWTTPTGMTERHEIQTPDLDDTMAIDDETIGAAGATGTRSSALGTTFIGSSWIKFAVRPAAETGLYSDAGTAKLTLTPSATEATEWADSASVAFLGLTASFELIEAVDAATVRVALTPSDVQVFEAVDAATVPLAFTPSADEYLSGQILDAATAALRLTASGLEGFERADTGSVYLDFAPSGIDVLHQCRPRWRGELITWDDDTLFAMTTAWGGYLDTADWWGELLEMEAVVNYEC
jgi:hypothetical protein